MSSAVFPDDITVDPYQSRRITTYRSYTLFPGTLAVQSITTTWPVVSTAQNGSGVADSKRNTSVSTATPPGTRTSAVSWSANNTMSPLGLRFSRSPT